MLLLLLRFAAVRMIQCHFAASCRLFQNIMPPLLPHLLLSLSLQRLIIHIFAYAIIRHYDYADIIYYSLLRYYYYYYAWLLRRHIIATLRHFHYFIVYWCIFYFRHITYCHIDIINITYYILLRHINTPCCHYYIGYYYYILIFAIILLFISFSLSLIIDITLWYYAITLIRLAYWYCRWYIRLILLFQIRFIRHY